MAFGAVPKRSANSIASFGNRFVGGSIPLQPGGSAAPASFGNMPNINTLPGVIQGRQIIADAAQTGFARQTGGGNPVHAGARHSFGGAQQQQQPAAPAMAMPMALQPPTQNIFSQPQQQQAINAIRAQAAQQANPFWQNKMDMRPGVSRDLSQPVTSQGIGRIAGINAQGMEDSTMQALQMRMANQQYQLQSNQLFADDQLAGVGAQMQRQALFANDDLMRKQMAMQMMGLL